MDGSGKVAATFYPRAGRLHDRLTMPSLRLCGQRWHLASDALALAGAALFLVNACWLAVYLGVLLALGRP